MVISAVNASDAATIAPTPPTPPLASFDDPPALDLYDGAC